MLGKRIKEKRVDAGLSQKALADKLGVSQQIIAFYELGSRKPTFDVLSAIADVLGCTTDHLLGRVG